MAPAPNNSSGNAPREEAAVKVPAKDPKKKDEKKDEDLVSVLRCGDHFFFNGLLRLVFKLE